MENYQTSQLEAASKILEMLSVPYPHTLPEKIKAIEASKVASIKLQGTVENYCMVMRKVASEIKAERLRQQSRAVQDSSTTTCAVD